jgi:hypothetical protein
MNRNKASAWFSAGCALFVGVIGILQYNQGNYGWASIMFAFGILDTLSAYVNFRLYKREN